MDAIEIINKGLKHSKTITIEVGNVRIFNVLVPSTEETRRKYESIAFKVIRKCGLRPKLAYYPIPPEVGRKKDMVPYFLVCLAKYREKKMKELN